MKKSLLILSIVFLLWSAAFMTQAQTRQILLRTNADVTLCRAKPDLNLGYDYSNEMCNWDSINIYGGNDSPEESWIRWDLGDIENQLLPGEEILYVEAIFRVSWNSGDTANAQGYRVLYLWNQAFDSWNEGNGVPGGAEDNLNGLTWNKAKSFTYDFEDPAYHDTLFVKKYAGVVPQKEYVNVFPAVKSELSDTGNKILTLRVVPYDYDYENIVRKKWLGFISLNSPASSWNLEVDDEGYPVEAPHLRFYVGIPMHRFSDWEKMGDTAYYSFKPTNFGSWMVEEDEGDIRLHLAQKTTVDTNTWNPGAVAVFQDTTFGDFDLNLKAKMNYVTPSGIFFPFNDFITVFGYVDENNFSYFAFYGDDESGTFTVIDGIRYRVGESKPMPAMMDTAYHNYRIVREGSTVTAYIDSVEYYSVTNDSLNTAGKVGVGSHNDEVFFDDIWVKDYSVPSAVKTIHAPVEAVLFPNPVPDQLSITSDEKLDYYTIRNVIGKTVSEGRLHGSGTNHVDVSRLSRGIYFITLRAGDKQSVKKFIKK